jgi:hypothetical protein
MNAIDSDAGKFRIGQSASGNTGWAPANDATRALLRTGGWQEYNDSGTLLREYTNAFSGSGVGASSQVYYFFENDTSPTNFAVTGPIDQGVQTYGDSNNGDFDKRTEDLTVAVRTQGQTYDAATTADDPRLVDTLKPLFVSLAVTEATDTNIDANDTAISTTTPYTGMSITYGSVTRSVGGTSYDFSVVIDGNNGTKQQIYEFVQYQLRQNSDIDAGAGTQNGLLADALLEFVGDTLKTKRQSDGGGVYIDNYNANDTNSIVFVDDTGTERSEPFVSAGNLVFNTNATGDSNTIYRMFFADNYPGASAVTVEDNSSTEIAGTVSGNGTISFDFDYDNNTQGGRTAGTDADVVVVAVGLGGAQHVEATGTITRATGLSIAISPAQENNYSNPA